MATEDGFVIAIAYGSRTGWLKNVLASGSATIVYEGGTSPVEHPEVIPIVAATTYFPAKARRAFHRYRVTHASGFVEPNAPGTRLVETYSRRAARSSG